MIIEIPKEIQNQTVWLSVFHTNNTGKPRMSWYLPPKCKWLFCDHEHRLTSRSKTIRPVPGQQQGVARRLPIGQRLGGA